MLEQIESFAKRHTLAIGIVATILVAYYFYAASNANSGGVGTVNNGAIADANAAEVQAASQYQIASLQASQAATQSNNQLTAAADQINGQIQVAQLQGQNAVSIATLQAQTQQNSDTLSAQTTQVVSALQAQVANTQSNDQLAATVAAIQGEVDIASLPYTSVTPALIAQVNNLTSQQSGIVGAINSVENNVNNLANDKNVNLATGGYLPPDTSGATNYGNNAFNLFSINGVTPISGSSTGGIQAPGPNASTTNLSAAA